MKIPLARSIPSISQSVLREHLSSPHHTPLHLPNLLTSWPGLDSWRLSDGLERLRQILGQDRQVEVELVNRGRGYLDPEFNRVHMPFGM